MNFTRIYTYPIHLDPKVVGIIQRDLPGIEALCDLKSTNASFVRKNGYFLLQFDCRLKFHSSFADTKALVQQKQLSTLCSKLLKGMPFSISVKQGKQVFRVFYTLGPNDFLNASNLTVNVCLLAAQFKEIFSHS